MNNKTCILSGNNIAQQMLAFHQEALVLIAEQSCWIYSGQNGKINPIVFTW
jgi:hypothetical protein